MIAERIKKVFMLPQREQLDPPAPNLHLTVLITETTSESDCKMERTYGYEYKTYYQIADSHSHNGDHILIQFYVQSVSDAHILLSSTSFPIDTDPVYEIVLGAGRNTFSDIRRLQKTKTKSTAITPDILSSTNLKGFWIRYFVKGLIEVGEVGNDVPFLFWQDTEPLTIRFFSFCTWGGVAGKWIFDCPTASTGATPSEAVQREMTLVEKLRRDLLTYYDPYARPVLQEDQRTVVSMQLTCHYVKLNEKKSTLTQWIDEKLKWDPDHYGNISQLNLAHHEVWTPEVVLYNAAGHGADILNEAGLVVNMDGRMCWAPQASLTAWCQLDLSAWPHDQHSCQLVLGFWSQQHLLDLIATQNTTMLSEQKTRSEWEVLRLEEKTAWTGSPWIEGNSQSDGEFTDMPTSNLVIQLTLRRLAQSYISIMIVPFIVQVYSWGMVASTISLLSSIFVIGLTRYSHLQPLPHVLNKYLAARPTRLLLCLPQTSLDSENYNQLEENHVPTTSTSSYDIQQQWVNLATVIDRVSCIVYCLFLGSILAAY
uniref:Neurotransmitter-gated ion-channel ligand-binding domain-containing protein n=1 Tax=Timema tahoe TaxID=61484 RepID=A0A7R9IM60_9NEOP|nr:unnamed protein product [Timema tahoe]